MTVIFYLALQLCVCWASSFVPRHILCDNLHQSYLSNPNQPIDIYNSFESNIIAAELDSAAVREDGQYMKWLLDSTACDEEKQNSCLLHLVGKEIFTEVALKFGHISVVKKMLKSTVKFYAFFKKIALSSIKLGYFDEIAEDIPITMFYTNDLIEILCEAIQHKKYFFSLFRILNLELSQPSPDSNQRKTILDMVKKKGYARIKRYLKMYPGFYDGSDYQAYALEYFNKYKNNHKMIQAFWANIASIDSTILIENPYIEARDAVASIPILGNLETALSINQPILIDYTLKYTTLTLESLMSFWRKRLPGFQYLVQKKSALNLLSTFMATMKENNQNILEKLGLDNSSSRKCKEMLTKLYRAFIVMLPEVIPLIGSQMTDLLEKHEKYLLDCCCFASFPQFYSWAGISAFPIAHRFPYAPIFSILFKEERTASGNDYQKFCKVVLDGPSIESSPSARLGLIVFGDLPSEDRKKLVTSCLTKGEYDIAYAGLMARNKALLDTIFEDTEFCELLVESVLPSLKNFFNPLAEILIDYGLIDASTLANKKEYAPYHHVLGPMFPPPFDLCSLCVQNSGTVPLFLVITWASGELSRILALNRIVPFLNLMNQIQILVALNSVANTII